MRCQSSTSSPYILTSVDRLTSECSDVSKAVDGSRCIFTIDSLESNFPVKLEKCPVCTFSALSLHEPIVLNQGTRLKLCLGQQPDLCEQDNCSSFRKLLEVVLKGCKTKEIITVCFDFWPCTDSDPDKGEKSTGTMVIRIEVVDNGPVCAHPTSPTTDQLCTTDGGDDPLVNPTCDWNPDLVAFWYDRARNLKQRGTWIIQGHNTNDESSDLHRTVWSAAFACYSRALQLASLARVALLNCTSNSSCSVSKTDDDQTCILGDQSDQERHSLIDLDRLIDFESDKLDGTVDAFVRLEFSLLLNLALCQLKVGSADSAAKVCTHALSQLDPGWIAVAENSTSVRPTDSAISSHDVAKCLYRRAQSLTAVTKLDEAVADLELASKLQKLDNCPHPGLAATESLMARARQQLSREQALLAERLRHRHELFH